MKIASFTSNLPTMSDTRTYEDFYKYLGVKPARLGVVTRMYDDLNSLILLYGGVGTGNFPKFLLYQLRKKVKK